MKLTYKGITAIQSGNYDIVLFKRGRMVLHLQHREKTDKQTLIAIIERYYPMLEGM